MPRRFANNTSPSVPERGIPSVSAHRRPAPSSMMAIVPRLARKISGDELTTASSATRQFSLEALHIHLEDLDLLGCERGQEVGAIQPGDQSGLLH